MKKVESPPQEVQKWFLSQIVRLWPVAAGSLSLRKNRCIRPRCQTCQSGEGHPSYALYLRRGKSRSVIYVPDNLVERLTTALTNGKTLQTLLMEAGVRYLKALKAQRERH